MWKVEIGWNGGRVKGKKAGEGKVKMIRVRIAEQGDREMETGKRVDKNNEALQRKEGRE